MMCAGDGKALGLDNLTNAKKKRTLLPGLAFAFSMNVMTAQTSRKDYSGALQSQDRATWQPRELISYSGELLVRDDKDE